MSTRRATCGVLITISVLALISAAAVIYQREAESNAWAEKRCANVQPRLPDSEARRECIRDELATPIALLVWPQIGVAGLCGAATLLLLLSPTSRGEALGSR